MENKINHALKPDAQGFDEIRLVTKPRYKTSGLSGNEWRISVRIEFWRKGKLVHGDFCGHDMGKAVQFVAWKYAIAGDEGKMFFGGGEDGKCDQEGCAEKATVFYRIKKKYCSEPYTHEPTELKETLIRQFCGKHSTRGDCAFEDSDANYELVEGTVEKPRGGDVSESAFGGVVTIDA